MYSTDQNVNVPMVDHSTSNPQPWNNTCSIFGEVLQKIFGTRGQMLHYTHRLVSDCVSAEQVVYSGSFLWGQVPAAAAAAAAVNYSLRTVEVN